MFHLGRKKENLEFSDFHKDMYQGNEKESVKENICYPER